MNWDERFELAKIYYEHHGDLMIKSGFKTKNGYEYDEDGFALGDWINAQRAQKNLGELTSEHQKKLESIGMFFGKVHDLSWDTFYELALNYLEKYHNLSIPSDFKTINGFEYNEQGKNLGAWLKVQRWQYKNDTLSQERKIKIEKLLTLSNKYVDLKWERMYDLSKIYYETHKNLNIPKRFKTIDGYTYDETGVNLGSWVYIQRRNCENQKLPQERIDKLEAIGIFFKYSVESEWERMYALAQNYYQFHHNLQISRCFKTIDGYTYDEKGSNLGSWINCQKKHYRNGSLSEEYIAKLGAIGMIFCVPERHSWDEMYELVKIYYENFHSLKFPKLFKTKNGYEYDADGFDLKIWINRQRKQYQNGQMTPEHKQKLEAIGMNFEKKWETMYELAKTYYEHYQTLIMDYEFKTIDGYTYDEKGEKLCKWLNGQRMQYKRGVLSQERIKKLEAIGMTFENLHNAKWEQMYNLACSYYNYHHHLKITSQFKTTDGYTYDENGKRLGDWISTQRLNYKENKLSSDRIIKLNKIGMIFEIVKDKQENKLICLTYDIDYDLHKKEIDKIPHREFLAKINYLNIQGIPFVIGKQLNPIFFESNINLQVKYGLSLETLIKQYTPTSEKVKKL